MPPIPPIGPPKGPLKNKRNHETFQFQPTASTTDHSNPEHIPTSSYRGHGSSRSHASGPRGARRHATHRSTAHRPTSAARHGPRWVTPTAVVVGVELVIVVGIIRLRVASRGSLFVEKMRTNKEKTLSLEHESNGLPEVETTSHLKRHQTFHSYRLNLCGLRPTTTLRLVCASSTVVQS